MNYEQNRQARINAAQDYLAKKANETKYQNTIRKNIAGIVAGTAMAASVFVASAYSRHISHTPWNDVERAVGYASALVGGMLIGGSLRRIKQSKLEKRTQ